MKKLIITMIAIAFSLSAYSADYKVCYEEKLTSLSDCSIELIKDGYIPAGGINSITRPMQIPKGIELLPADVQRKIRTSVKVKFIQAFYKAD